MSAGSAGAPERRSVLSRFPDAKQTTLCIKHLKKEKNRATATGNIVWAMANSKEFMMGAR
jgi:hypothetical protein